MTRVDYQLRLLLLEEYLWTDDQRGVPTDIFASFPRRATLFPGN